MKSVIAAFFFVACAAWSQTNGVYDVPVVYGRPVNDAVLPPDLIQGLVREASALVKDQKPWFVYVEQSQAGMSTCVYFEPTAQADRLQKGLFVRCAVVNAARLDACAGGESWN